MLRSGDLFIGTGNNQKTCWILEKNISVLITDLYRLRFDHTFTYHLPVEERQQRNKYCIITIIVKIKHYKNSTGEKYAFLQYTEVTRPIYIPDFICESVCHR